MTILPFYTLQTGQYYKWRILIIEHIKVIDHSADNDYNDFMKIHRECTKEPSNFLTIDTMLPASDPLRFTKNLFDSL